MSGQLGHGDEENQLAPRRVPAAGFNGERVVMVAAGDTHTVVGHPVGAAAGGGRAVRGREGCVCGGWGTLHSGGDGGGPGLHLGVWSLWSAGAWRWAWRH